MLGILARSFSIATHTDTSSGRDWDTPQHWRRRARLPRDLPRLGRPKDGPKV